MTIREARRTCSSLSGMHVPKASDPSICKVCGAWLGEPVPLRSPLAREGRSRELRDAGQRIAVEAAPDPWREAFDAALRRWAASGREFTSEDVTAEVGLPRGQVATNRNNAVGALMTAAAKRGAIVKTGRYQPSRNQQAHGAILAVWRGA